MTLRKALGHISAVHYFKVCGYSYRDLHHYGDKKYSELPKDFQDGIMVMIVNLFEIQKMTYCYEIELVTIYMKKNGIKLKPFFADNELPSTFWKTLSLHHDRNERLMNIRRGMMHQINLLFAFIFYEDLLR